ncbi:hypothetical protein [Cohnella herbarum]|uniref:RNase H type-1 domain-containing protein n=1 Tax=Cohnella herbarum TaxID=2728023 RepID=A0A7Z2VGX5_9BACL|nr:hypothetical protein [Cohnella herbarum]QJD82998.1 hypothetical protein HH215_07305 [Cohnella herbarum]
MDSSLHFLVKRAYATPSLRQNMMNSGMICMYSDFSGQKETNDCGIACCWVYRRNIYVDSKQVTVEQIGDSVHGELLAIVYSLEILGETLAEMETRPKIAMLYTDCSCIARLISKDSHLKPQYEEMRNQITATINGLKMFFPEISVRVKYISNHKKNNALHKIAHVAARKAIGKS